MNREDIPGYMFDEVQHIIDSIEVKTVDELQEYYESEGGQVFEELGVDLIRMCMEAK